MYLSPAAACALLRLWGPGAVLFLSGIYILPGGMTRNAAHRDVAYLVRPDRALRVAIGGGRAYLKAWLIAGCAIALSFVGLIALGVGFLWTSVWAWTVVGHAFTRALQVPINRS